MPQFLVKRDQIKNGAFTLEKEEAKHAAKVLRYRVGDPIHLFIGPEGGFATEEIEVAKRRGLATVSLGTQVLRAETAAIATASLILLG